MQPDFIVTDMFYPWFADAAADSESSVLPGLPHRGHANEEEEEGLLTWLDSKKEESVLYAMILISSGWLGKLIKVNEAKGFVEEFEKRVQASNKGYIIWGWAAQLLILELW
ncbi:hypothetical protein JHK87_029365 [Glycine soja]|nr:hypothetical protein JHK87_029365 [Glycine soja]